MFSNESGLLVQFLTALGVVLILIVLLAWILKKVNLVSARVGRDGEEARLSVKEALQVDHKRKLVLVRRDNIEHLLLVGGENDLLVEHHILPLHPTHMQQQAPGSHHSQTKGPPVGQPRPAPPRPAPQQAGQAAPEVAAKRDSVPTQRGPFAPTPARSTSTPPLMDPAQSLPEKDNLRADPPLGASVARAAAPLLASSRPSSDVPPPVGQPLSKAEHTSPPPPPEALKGGPRNLPASELPPPPLKGHGETKATDLPKDDFVASTSATPTQSKAERPLNEPSFKELDKATLTTKTQAPIPSADRDTEDEHKNQLASDPKEMVPLIKETDETASKKQQDVMQEAPASKETDKPAVAPQEKPEQEATSDTRSDEKQAPKAATYEEEINRLLDELAGDSKQ